MKDYTDGLVRKYNYAEPDYQTPIKRLSENKRQLVSNGLPLLFYNEVTGVDGEITLTDRGEIVVVFNKVNHNILLPPSKSYLIDVPDYLLVELLTKK